MEYVVFNKITGEIHSFGSRPDEDPYSIPEDMVDYGVITEVSGSHNCYVDVRTKLLVQKPPKPEGVAVFNYATKQWDVDEVETVRTFRANEYPSIGDQLDALWKLIKANADKIDLAEAAPLFEAVQAVKDKYPKPPTSGID